MFYANCTKLPNRHLKHLPIVFVFIKSKHFCPHFASQKNKTIRIYLFLREVHCFFILKVCIFWFNISII